MQICPQGSSAFPPGSLVAQFGHFVKHGVEWSGVDWSGFVTHGVDL